MVRELVYPRESHQLWPIFDALRLAYHMQRDRSSAKDTAAGWSTLRQRQTDLPRRCDELQQRIDGLEGRVSARSGAAIQSAADDGTSATATSGPALRLYVIPIGCNLWRMTSEYFQATGRSAPDNGMPMLIRDSRHMHDPNKGFASTSLRNVQTEHIAVILWLSPLLLMASLDEITPLQGYAIDRRASSSVNLEMNLDLPDDPAISRRPWSTRSTW